jgi:hypothetical protein
MIVKYMIAWIPMIFIGILTGVDRKGIQFSFDVLYTHESARRIADLDISISSCS